MWKNNISSLCMSIIRRTNSMKLLKSIAYGHAASSTIDNYRLFSLQPDPRLTQGSLQKPKSVFRKTFKNGKVFDWNLVSKLRHTTLIFAFGNTIPLSHWRAKKESEHEELRNLCGLSHVGVSPDGRHLILRVSCVIIITIMITIMFIFASFFSLVYQSPCCLSLRCACHQVCDMPGLSRGHRERRAALRRPLSEGRLASRSKSLLHTHLYMYICSFSLYFCIFNLVSRLLSVRHLSRAKSAHIQSYDI